MLIIDDYIEVFRTIINPKETKQNMTIRDAFYYYLRATLIPVIILTLGAIADISFLHFVPIGALSTSLSTSFSFGWIADILSALVYFSASSFIGQSVISFGIIVLAATILLAYLIFIPITAFLSAGVIHLFGKRLFRFFNGDYVATFSAVVYGITVSFCLVFIPLVDLIFKFIGIIVLIIAISNQQKIDLKKALLCAIPILVLTYIMLI